MYYHQNLDIHELRVRQRLAIIETQHRSGDYHRAENAGKVSFGMVLAQEVITNCITVRVNVKY
jgi:hypothetical protein